MPEVSINGLTAERMLEIEGESITGATRSGDNLILLTRSGKSFNLGSFRGDPGELTRDELTSTFARRRAYDPRDFIGNDDIGAGINRAIEAAYLDQLAFGKAGQVILPPGNFAQTTEISWRLILNGQIQDAHGVDLIGSGWGKTVLRPQGRMNGLHHISQSSADALHDVLIANFEIDGSEQNLLGQGYTPAIKGSYMVKLRRVVIDHLYVHDTGATGIGHDYHQSCIIRDSVVNGCGRLNDGTGGGGAGIGIGTGNWNVEDLLVEGCTTNDNKRDGLFFETQLGDMPEGARVIGHVAQRNGRHGIEDAGVRGLEVIGGLVRKNVKSGFATSQGTIDPGAPGVGGKVKGLRSMGNGEHGFHVDWTGRVPVSTSIGFSHLNVNEAVTYYDRGYEFDECVGQENAADGFRVEVLDTAVPDIRVRNGDFSFNQRAGILGIANGTGGLTDLVITGNRTVGNGRNATAARQEGIVLNAPLTRPVIKDNVSRNPAGVTTQTYGFRLLGNYSWADATIDGNDFRGNATAAYSFGGSFAGLTHLGLNVGWTIGITSPEGVVLAPAGTIYKRVSVAGPSLYVKETTTGSTGWALK